MKIPSIKVPPKFPKQTHTPVEKTQHRANGEATEAFSVATITPDTIDYEIRREMIAARAERLSTNIDSNFGTDLRITDDRTSEGYRIVWSGGEMLPPYESELPQYQGGSRMWTDDEEKGELVEVED